MKQRGVVSVAKVVLVLVAGVASMATSSNRRPPVASPASLSPWHEVMAVVEPQGTSIDDEEGATSVWDLSTSEALASRSWVETIGDGARVRHVLIDQHPVPGHRYGFYYRQGDAWATLEQTYAAPPATYVRPVDYYAPSGARYVYYPYRPQFAQPPAYSRYQQTGPYVYRSW